MSINADTLASLGFECSGGIDWERYPNGFGVDGADRTERISEGLDGNLYAHAYHRGPNGEENYDESSPAGMHTIQELSDWLIANREVAPGRHCGCSDALVAEWTGLHYRVNFDAEIEDRKAEWRKRYIQSHAGGVVVEA